MSNSNWVNNVVSEGYRIPFKYVPQMKFPPSNPVAHGPAYDVLVSEAEALQQKNAIFPVEPCEGHYISSYFAVPKPRSEKFRPILNLKRFNKSIKKYKFKLEGFSQLREWIKPGAFMCSLDLKDMFLHVPINKLFTKFLRFSWLDTLHEWRVLPFGLRCSPRVVTKVLKPVLAFLRSTFSMLITVYIDDFLVQASSPEEAVKHAKIAALVLMALGWSLNWEKSNFIPSQEVLHLGFIDTKHMIAKCPQDKVLRLQGLCKEALQNGFISAHALECLLGTMESVRPVTKFAALHYRSLQRQLLKANFGGRKSKETISLKNVSIFSTVVGLTFRFCF